MHCKVWVCSLGVLLGAQSVVLSAQETGQIEEVLVSGQMSRYSALKSDIPIMETARSVSIESLQQIIDKGALVLDDTFTYSAGVTGEVYGFSTRGDWVRVRGLQVPQYQDSLQSLFGNYNNTRPDIYTLEQVEILKGPASVLYGQGSPGGIVNVISKRPSAESHRELLLEAGTFQHKRIGIDMTGALDVDEKWLYRQILSYKDSGSQVDYVDETSIVFSPMLTYRPSENTNISVLLNYTKTDGDTAAQFSPRVGTLEPTPEGRLFSSNTYLGEPGFNYYKPETKAATLIVEHTFNDVWSMEATARYTDAQAVYQQAWLNIAYVTGDPYVRNPDGSLYKDGLTPRTFYRSANGSEQIASDIRFRADFDTGIFEHNVLVGVQYQDVSVSSGRAYLPGNPGTDGNRDDTYWLNPFNPVYGAGAPEALLAAAFRQNPDSVTVDKGLYISDQISVGALRATFGLRFDSTKNDSASGSQSDDDINGSAGLLYLFDSGLAPYVSYSQSFDTVAGDDGKGNALKPEEGEQYELGVKYQPDSMPIIVTAAYFDLTKSNLRIASFPPGTYEQTGEVAIDGWELEAQARFGDFNLELNYSDLNTKNLAGNRIDSVPERQFSTWLGYRPEGRWQGLKSGVGLRYVGESWDGTDTLRTASHTLYDLMLGYEFSDWNVALNVRNVSDKKYLSTCLLRGDCFWGDRRTVVASLRYQF